MRLCYVIHQFFPYAMSGTEQHCLAMAREARRRGDEVTIVSLHWDHDREDPPVRAHDEPYDGFPVIRLGHWRGLNANETLRDYENQHLEAAFRRILEDARPDATHFFHLRQLGANLLQVAKETGCRVVLSLTDFWFLCPRFTLLRSDGYVCSGPLDGGRACVPCHEPDLAGVAPGPSPATTSCAPGSRLRALLDRPVRLRSAMLSADAVIAPSRFLADMFSGNGFAHPRMQVTPYGLEPGRVRAAAVSRPRSPLRVAFCGVLSPWKAPRLLVDAFAHVTAPAVASIHGRLEEPMFADYIASLRHAAAADPRIRLAGAYGAAEVDDVFADMDVLVVPSVWYENTPFVVLEAFAAGVPVVASDLGGLSEVVRGGENGFLFPAGDARSLGALLQSLAADPGRLLRLRMPTPSDICSNYDAVRPAYLGD